MEVRRVRWRDSKMMIYQESQEQDFDVAILESVGFVLQEDEHRVVLAGDVVGDCVRRVIVIPKENIEACKRKKKREIS
jgi:hypothetical protein